MMPKPRSLYTSLFIAFLVSLSAQRCGSSTRASQENMDELVKSKLGSSYSITYNESKKYALCQQTSGNNGHAYRSFKFLVVKVSTNEIANEGSFQNGYVKWIDDRSVEVSSSQMNEKRETKILRINDQQS